MAEDLYAAVYVTSVELVLTFLLEAQHRKALSLLAMELRFRVPPGTKNTPYGHPTTPAGMLWDYPDSVYSCQGSTGVGVPVLINCCS